MSELCQVIIKNTNASKDSSQSTSSTSINRSQSLLTTNRIPVLAPSRAERIRLEALLSDVWTRDVLPFPGMASRARNEHLVRASASSMIRKLSVASIASNFTKRSGSMASLHKAVGEDGPVENEGSKLAALSSELSSRDNISLTESEDTVRTRLAVIQDEKENILQDSLDGRPSAPVGSNGSSAGTLRRLATLKVKKSWGGHDGQRITTPPLRTSSANSLSQSRTSTLSTVADVPTEEKENMPQAQAPKEGKWGKGVGRDRGVMVDGIRRLFR